MKLASVPIEPLDIHNLFKDPDESESVKFHSSSSSNLEFEMAVLPNTYSIKLSHALEMVLVFTETPEGSTIDQFVAGCLDAKKILPATAEKNLTLLLWTKLKGEAFDLLRETKIETVAEFVKALKEIYSPIRSSIEICAELTRLT